MNEYIIDYILDLTDKIDRWLPQGIEPEKGVLETAIHYALTVKGKRLRPMLFLSLVEAYKFDPMEYMDIACAIECIHTYSLIHDDLPTMDDDDYRRGMPTVHKKFNEAIALLAGDTLLTHAFELISYAKIDSQKTVNILRILTQGIGKDGMAGGQALDLEFHGQKDVIFRIHRMKTAALIKAALLCAAEVIGLKDNEKKIIGDVGEIIGLGFQMADDLLDQVGDEKEVGKKLQKDDSNDSPNSVLYYGKDSIREEIDSSYTKTMSLLKQLNIDFSPFLYLMEKMVYRSR